ncbi:hypothetical protein [uncultured Haemophilus sp.]|jgi:hypothetical protein|uniref:hypothetical protein n=2 Tax=uncultured Haemophilus sp. TaxID=237779 RepID=UPI001CB41C81|nr:hypothetical protein [uncultured Haemophilus sp.]MBF1228428.1 hypothetical protein [Haemophilus parainfluenzae]
MKAYMKKKITLKEFKNRQEKMSRDLGQLFSRKEQKEMKKEMIKLKRKNKFIEKNCMISAAKLRKMIEKVKELDLDNEISIF